MERVSGNVLPQTRCHADCAQNGGVNSEYLVPVLLDEPADQLYREDSNNRSDDESYSESVS